MLDVGLLVLFSRLRRIAASARGCSVRVRVNAVPFVHEEHHHHPEGANYDECNGQPFHGCAETLVAGAMMMFLSPR